MSSYWYSVNMIALKNHEGDGEFMKKSGKYCLLY